MSIILTVSLAGLACAALPPPGPIGPAPAPPEGAGPPPDAAVTLGPPTVLLSAGQLGLSYFPDQALTVLDPAPSLRVLLTAGVSTWLAEGPDLEHLQRARQVIVPGPRGAPDNGYVGVGGAVEHEGRLYAAYHAEDHEGMPALPGTGGVPGFHASVGIASSTDHGQRWEKLGPAVTSHLGKGVRAFPGQADSGAGEPWLTRSADGHWWLLYYTEHDRDGGRGVQICLARAPATRPPTPGAFTKWFQGAFSEPALGGRDTPILSAQRFDGADAFGPHVVWSAALRRYVMTFVLDAWKELREQKGLRRSGIYLATSEDGVAWSRPEPMFIDWPVNVVGLPVSWHPAIVFDAGSSTAGWLVYGHTDRWDPPRGTPHHLWGRRITLAPRR